MQKTKICKKCNQEKSTTEFYQYLGKVRQDGKRRMYFTKCKKCEYSKAVHKFSIPLCTLKTYQEYLESYKPINKNDYK